MQFTQEMQSMIEEINEAAKEIPFGNSAFQNLTFVMNNEVTPGRALRHCLLRLQNRIAALRESYYNFQLENIDIEEMQEKINIESDKFEKRRIIIKLEQKRVNRVSSEKLINDCVEEIKTLYSAFKNIPKYTRETFELEESEHYRLKLGRDFAISLGFGGAAGIVTSLDNMGIAVSSLQKIQDGKLNKELENAMNIISEITTIKESEINLIDFKAE